MQSLWMVFGVSGALCLVLTPLLRGLAIRCGLVDHPDGDRKTHDRPIPLAGGLAILLSGTAAFLSVRALGWNLPIDFQEDGLFLSGLLAASICICFLGVVDDRLTLRGRYKLIGQILIVTIPIMCNVIVRTIDILGYEIELGILAVPFTMIWLLGAINSLNLLDGMDGLLSSIGLVICLALAGMAFHTGHMTTVCLALTLGGALAGFLCYNLPPASVFLGDAGSMLIGLVIGVLAIHGTLKGPATVALTVPIAILAIPFFDTAAAVARRKLTGRSIYFPDREHLHHCLQRRGFSNRRILAFVATFCAITAAGAIVTVVLKNDLFALVTSLLVISVLVVTRMFGYSEFLLMRQHLLVFASTWGLPTKERSERTMEVRLNGSADWQALWAKLTDVANAHGMSALMLDVSAASGNERYHARWGSGESLADTKDEWKTTIPLTAGNMVVGRLEAAGRRNCRSMSKQIAMLADLIDDLETGLPALLVTQLRAHMPHGAPGEPADVVVEGSRVIAAKPMNGAVFGDLKHSAIPSAE
jgi:UDP-GlcNAc:undecaprenyl-phosphate/decaprenyl-phosphate GlcNAc-1-phosphate transferase